MADNEEIVVTSAAAVIAVVAARRLRRRRQRSGAAVDAAKTVFGDELRILFVSVFGDFCRQCGQAFSA